MIILVVFNSFNVVKNLKKPDPVAYQKPPFYTTYIMSIFKGLKPSIRHSKINIRIQLIHDLLCSLMYLPFMPPSCHGFSFLETLDKISFPLLDKMFDSHIQLSFLEQCLNCQFGLIKCPAVVSLVI